MSSCVMYVCLMSYIASSAVNTASPFLAEKTACPGDAIVYSCTIFDSEELPQININASGLSISHSCSVPENCSFIVLKPTLEGSHHSRRECGVLEARAAKIGDSDCYNTTITISSALPEMDRKEIIFSNMEGEEVGKLLIKISRY